MTPEFLAENFDEDVFACALITRNTQSLSLILERLMPDTYNKHYNKIMSDFRAALENHKKICPSFVKKMEQVEMKIQHLLKCRHFYMRPTSLQNVQFKFQIAQE